MTPDQRARMTELCTLIQKEKDPNRFEGHVRQLTDLLDNGSEHPTGSETPESPRKRRFSGI
jgi:hypothetical protein